MIHIIVKNNGLDKALRQSASALEHGGIIAYPTETFYGLGVRFDREEALERLYHIKLRPKEKAMPLIIGDTGLLKEVVSEDWLKNMPVSAQKLMQQFWPGPLTILMPAKACLSERLTGGTGMIAVRIPGESFALHLAKKTGFPFTATSANISGMPPAEDAEKVIGYFGDSVELLIDGGMAAGGLPSTIVDASTDKIIILRRGAVDISLIQHY